MTESVTILVVEDDPQQRQLVSSILQGNGFTVCDADCVEAAIVQLKQQAIDVIFSDWKLGQLSGLDLLKYVRSHLPETGFAIATAYGTISHAVEAIEQGADDYLAKPFQRQELLLCIDKVNNARLLRQRNKLLSHALSEQQQLVDLVGSAPCMQKVYQRIERVSATDATVLITGESGTGKELAARALHTLSPRHNDAFIAVNCGAIPESLAEAELFGARKGAYTGADSDKVGKLQSADQGTLFLDEIGELSLPLQTRLLRFLQEGTVTPLGSSEEIKLDVRVIAATHRNLPDMVAKGEFREDLFYRLNIVPVEMPALRERQEDIPRLVEHFIASSCHRYRLPEPTLSRDSLKNLMDYPWPGNVRELANRIERFVLLQDEQELVTPTAVKADQSSFTLPEQGLNWDEFERDCLVQALQRHQGNRTAAAKFLGMSYKTFIYRMDKYQLNNA